MRTVALIATVGLAVCRSGIAVMTLIRLSDSKTAAALAAHLRARPDLVVERVGDNRLQVSVLGSYSAEAMRLELYLRVRAWETAQRARGRAVEVELDG
jgi:hypothetical protein